MNDIKNKKNHPLAHAIDGLKWSLQTQVNYRIHLLLSALAIIVGCVVKLSYTEWLFIIMAITIGLVIEAINTAIEATTDAITKDWSQQIKIAKDVSASAMLTYSIGILILASVIYIPKILNLFS